MTDTAAGSRDGAAGKRVGLLLGLGALAAAGFFALRSGGGPAAPEKTLDELYREDDRIALLVHGCPFGRTYDADTTQMNRILVAKMESGHRDPIRRFKQELADIGAPIVPELERLYDEAYQHRFRMGVVENILAVCALMKEPWGLELVRKGFGHPKESVRLTALDGLRLHGSPEDYDSVAAWLPLASSEKALADYAGAMESLDPERFHADFAAWLEKGLYPEVWSYAAPGASLTTDPEVVARYRAAADLRGGPWRPFLIAAAARDGDEEALAELRANLTDENPSVVQWSLDALARVGLAGEGYGLFRDHELAAVRQLAADKIAEMEPSEQTTVWLLEGLSDLDAGVRESCMVALVERGNERALRNAFALLQGGPGDRDSAMRALRRGWESNPGSSEEALNILVRLLEERAGSDGERVAILQQIGLVPERRAAELLMDFALTHEAIIKGRSLHRWMCGQVFNTGPAGRGVLKERLAVETDPFRRLDLISYIWQDHTEESRETLLAFLTDPTRNEYERLYAADRLIRMGPASRIAPILKRMYLDSTHRWGRPAYQCLLWIWYGIPNDPGR